MALLAAFIIGGMGRYVFGPWMPALVLGAIATAVGLAVASLHLRLRPVHLADEVRVEAGDVWFATQRVSREQIMSLWRLRRSTPAGEQTQIELPLAARRRTLGPIRSPGDVVIIDVAGEEDARALMSELALDGWQAQRRVRLGELSIARAALMLALAFGVGVVLSALGGGRLGETERDAYVWGITLFPLVFISVHGFASVLRREPTLSILRDGVVLHGLLRRTHIAWSKIVSVEATRSELRIGCRDGVVRVRASDFDEARAAAILELIREQLAEQMKQRSAHFAVYARGDSDVSHWFRRLRELVVSPSYRANSASIDEAVTVLTSPAASADERVGAAVVLRLAGVDLSETHFRVNDVANEKVRVVLQRVEDAREDDEIEAELSRMRT